MSTSIQTIPIFNLALALIPVCVVIVIHFLWSREHRTAIYGVSRMLLQLLMIGYFLTYIFDSGSAWITLAVLAVMIFSASWIGLRTVRHNRLRFYPKALLALILGGGITLFFVIKGVLNLTPWYWPNYFIPLAGMIFANAMNSISLAADRLDAEMGRDVDYKKARNIAFRASLIPITNSLFAVGLVSMCMVFGASGISSACFLSLVKPNLVKDSI
jgi:putative ABC transport system permease protein